MLILLIKGGGPEFGKPCLYNTRTLLLVHGVWGLEESLVFCFGLFEAGLRLD